MSEEIERIIKECSCVDTFDYVITPQQRDTMLLAEYIKELQQENQQLKEQLKLVESLTCFNMPNNTPMVCMFKADYERNKYEYETIDKYKSVLDEIRECTRKYCSGIFTDEGETVFVTPTTNILQILEKVKE